MSIGVGREAVRVPWSIRLRGADLTVHGGPHHSQSPQDTADSVNGPVAQCGRCDRLKGGNPTRQGQVVARQIATRTGDAPERGYPAAHPRPERALAGGRGDAWWQGSFR